MEVAEHLAQLEQDGARLASVATSLDAEVPPCDRLDHDPARRGEDLATPGSRDPVEWFREGHTALLDVLRGADPDLQCYTFLPAPSPLAFWARRQAHETAIHRADAESATGAITPFPTSFATDGIDEMLTGFAARRRSFSRVDGPRTLALRPTDADGWTVTLAPDGVHPESGAGTAEATITGTASDLYLWVWNRPATAVVDGDHDVVALWQHVRVRWS